MARSMKWWKEEEIKHGEVDVVEGRKKARLTNVILHFTGRTRNEDLAFLEQDVITTLANSPSSSDNECTRMRSSLHHLWRLLSQAYHSSPIAARHGSGGSPPYTWSKAFTRQARLPSGNGKRVVRVGCCLSQSQFQTMVPSHLPTEGCEQAGHRDRKRWNLAPVDEEEEISVWSIWKLMIHGRYIIFLSVSPCFFLEELYRILHGRCFCLLSLS